MTVKEINATGQIDGRTFSKITIFTSDLFGTFTVYSSEDTTHPVVIPHETRPEITSIEGMPVL